MERKYCPTCDGDGYVMEHGCCWNVLSDGQCCGNSVPVMERCPHCHGEGFVYEMDESQPEYYQNT